jgi:hypothetical protein
MARRKASPSEETPDFTHEDISNADLGEVIAGELDKKEEVKEEPKVEEKKEEVKAEEKKETEVDFNPDELAEKTAQKAADMIEKKFGDKLTPQEKKVEEKTIKEQLVEAKEKFEDEYKRTPTWDELAEIMTTKAIENTMKSIEKREMEKQTQVQKEQEEMKRKEDETKATEAQKEEQKKVFSKRLNDSWDEELVELTRAGKLPPVANKDDKNDLGVRARTALWGKMQEVNQKRIDSWIEEFKKTNGKDPSQEDYNSNPPRLVTSLGTVFALYYKAPNEQPAGEDAPVSAGSKPVSQGAKQTFSYQEVHNKTIDELLSGN